LILDYLVHNFCALVYLVNFYLGESSDNISSYCFCLCCCYCKDKLNLLLCTEYCDTYLLIDFNLFNKIYF